MNIIKNNKISGNIEGIKMGGITITDKFIRIDKAKDVVIKNINDAWIELYKCKKANLEVSRSFIKMEK